MVLKIGEFWSLVLFELWLLRSIITLPTLDENKNIFTDVINNTIYLGGNNSTVSVGKDLYVPNNFVVQGNFTQHGDTTTVNSTNVDIEDKDDRYTLLVFEIEVRNRQHLAQVIKRIRRIKHISHIRR